MKQMIMMSWSENQSIGTQFNFLTFVYNFKAIVQPAPMPQHFECASNKFTNTNMTNKFLLSALLLEAGSIQGPHSYGVLAFCIWIVCEYFVCISSKATNLIGCDKSCDIRIIEHIIVCCQQGQMIQQV